MGWSERRLVCVAGAAGGRPGPRVARLLPCRRSGCGTCAVARVAVDCRGGVAEGRADLVDLNLVHDPLLPFLRLVGPLLEVPGDDDAGAFLDGVGEVLSCLPPDRAPQIGGFPVAPFVAVLVEDPG